MTMEGLILKVQPYRDNDRMCFVHTPEGKRTLIARSAQKTNNADRILAQYMTRISFKDAGRPIQTLSGGTILDGYPAIKDDVRQLRHAAVVLEILDRVVIGDFDHQSIYDNAIQALDAPLVKEASFAFALRMTRPLGIGISLEADGRPVKGVSVDRGGIVYKEESIHADLDVQDTIVVLKLMRIPYESLEALDEATCQRIIVFIRTYYQYHLNVTLKTL